MIAVDCLDKEALYDLLTGRLPSERFEEALRHVDSCEHCAAMAAELSTTSNADPLAEVLAAPAHNPIDSPSNFDSESQCHIAIGNLLVRNHNQSQERQPDLPQDSLGPYRLLRSLGIGGMGAVYLAEHQKLKRFVAIKLLPRDKLTRAGWLERFEREMTAVAALEHPHVVRAIDAGESDGWHYLVMEHLDGLDLSRIARRVPDISVGAACEVIRQAALGLSAVHEQGLVHRDVKPSNIFLTGNGVAKLLDLGLVLDGESPLATDERLTTVGHLMGTLPYMAREQLSDARSVDARTDIYALGATLTKLLTGTPPFGSSTHLPSLIQAISTQSCPPLRSRRAEVNRDLAEFVDRMLDHDPSQRPQTAGEVAERLAPFCDAAATTVLVKTALQCDPVADELSIDQPNLQLATALDSSGSFASRRWKWLAWAAVPIAFAAGILLTVATDNGTLTIETDQDNVAIKILQGQAEVRNLVVERDSPQKLRLRSGSYVVELAGLDTQQLTISDNRVAISRGSEELLTVTRSQDVKPSATPQSSLANESVYQGQTFNQWLNVLARDKDIESLDKAMEGLVLLAETKDQKLTVAKSMLEAARTYGGIVLMGRISQQQSNPSGFAAQRDFNSLSGYFMSAFCDCFPRLLPDAGLEAIAEELRDGNPRSWQACAMIFQMELNDRPLVGQPNLHDLLDALVPRIDFFHRNLLPVDGQAVTIPRGKLAITYGMLMRFKMQLANQLDLNLTDDPQFADWADFHLEAARVFLSVQDGVRKESYGAAGTGATGTGGIAVARGSFAPTDFSNDAYGGLTLSFSITASDAELYFQALKNRDVDLSPLAVGIARGEDPNHVDGGSGLPSEPERLATFRAICQRDYPSAARALEKFVATCITVPVVDGGFGSVANYIAAYGIDPELAREITSVLVQHHPSPFKASIALAIWSEKCKLVEGTEPIDWKPYFEQVLERCVMEPASQDPIERAAMRKLAAWQVASLQHNHGYFSLMKADFRNLVKDVIQKLQSTEPELKAFSAQTAHDILRDGNLDYFFRLEERLRNDEKAKD